MTVMSANLYRALLKANVPDEMAQKAAEEVAAYDTRFASIETRLLLLTWMVGVMLAGVVSLVMKAFF